MPRPHARLTPAEGTEPLLCSLGELLAHCGADTAVYAAELRALDLDDEVHPPEPSGAAGPLVCLVVSADGRGTTARQGELPRERMSRGLLAAVVGAPGDEADDRARAVRRAVTALCSARAGPLAPDVLWLPDNV